ncbi:hypothetical protein GQ42DRAFT_163358 [Ramicandelaber brevisporus]|nr:hypothetical protein GQ42DRAFT_163358 [Ramicandelaber brevisporus]
MSFKEYQDEAAIAGGVESSESTPLLPLFPHKHAEKPASAAAATAACQEWWESFNARFWRAIVASRVLIGILSSLATIAIIAAIVVNLVLPPILNHPFVAHLRIIGDEAADAICHTQAWSVFAQSPVAACARSSPVLQSGAVHVVREEFNASGLTPSVMVRAGGAVRANVVIASSNSVDDIVVELSHSSPNQHSHIYTLISLQRPGLWTYDSSVPEHILPALVRIDDDSEVIKGCTLANITVSVPVSVTHIQKVFVAAASLETLGFRLGKDVTVGSVNVIEPLRRSVDIK